MERIAPQTIPTYGLESALWQVNINPDTTNSDKREAYNHIAVEVSRSNIKLFQTLMNVTSPELIEKAYAKSIRELAKQLPRQDII